MLGIVSRWNAAKAPKSESKPKPAPAKRAAASSTPVFARPAATAGVRNEGGGGAMPEPVRSTIEKSLQVDLGGVRVHSDGNAHTATKNLSARAFTYGNNIVLGQGERPTDVGLMAHEAAHVVQQRGAPKLQRWSSRNQSDACETEAHRASAAVLSGQTFAVNERTSGAKVQRFGISDLLDYFADKANNIPGYRMFTVIIGVNPINGETVERTPANIFRAAIELIPGGKLITDVLEKHGLLEKGANWVATQFKKLAMVGQAFIKAIEDFVDDLSWRDLFHPFRLWDKAKHIVLDPVEKIIDFVVGLVDGIIELIKKAILIPLAKLAEGTAGWDLLCAVLGKNPITGDPVPRTAETLIGGFMKLIHQEEIWENIKKANALSRAWAWFTGAIEGLIGFVKEIPTLFIDALKSLELVDILILPKAFIKIGKVFGNFFLRFISWAGETIWNLLQIIFEVVAPSIMPYLKKAMAAFRSILKNPIGFVGNLVKAAKQGFQLFSSNFLSYLKKALIGWLTGTLEGANIYIPQGFTLMEILKFVLSVLGLTWQNIRQKLVKVIGETAVKALETGFDLVVTLVRDGPAAAWQKILEGLSNLKEMVIDGIMSFVKDRIITAAVTKLLSMLNPAGAFIQAIIAIYNTIMFFIERLKQIGQVVAAFIDSISAIANGIIGPASQKVADTLGGLLTLVISFLARLVGLGKVSDAVKNIIDKVRDPINKALDKAVDWIVEMAKKAGKFIVGKVQSAAQRLTTWWAAKKTFPAADGTHTLFFKGDDESAVLTLRSDETPFSDFVSRLKTGTDAKKVKAKNEAVRISGLIDTERKTKPSPDTEEERGKKATRVNDLLDELKGHTKILLGPTIPDSKAPVFGGANSANFGISMVVKPLTNVNREEGTGPTSSANPTYAALNERRDSPGGASYYIKGHLLNQQLGGKGIWDNLTPLSRSGNAQHERQVESVVKRTVDLPAIVEYSVTPAYAARGDKPALLTAISKSLDSAESKRVKTEIVQAEESVPKSLSIEAHILDETLARKDTVIKQSVNNEIDRNYSSYFLSSSPKPVPVNLSVDMEDKLETLPGIGPVLAKRIVQVREDRKKQGLTGRFSSYKQIAELVTGIGEGKLEELEKAGHVSLY